MRAFSSSGERSSVSASRTRSAPSMMSPRNSASARRPAAVSALADTKEDRSSTSARAARASLAAIAESPRCLSFSTERSRASATASRSRMKRRLIAATAATPPAAQPSQSARSNRSRISLSVHRPSAIDTRMPSADRKIAPSLEWRRGGLAGGGSRVASPGSSNMSISAGTTTAFASIARGGLGLSRSLFGADFSGLADLVSGSTRKAAGLRAVVMRGGLP